MDIFGKKRIADLEEQLEQVLKAARVIRDAPAEVQYVEVPPPQDDKLFWQDIDNYSTDRSFLWFIQSVKTSALGQVMAANRTEVALLDNNEQVVGAVKILEYLMSQARDAKNMLLKLTPPDAEADNE